MKNIYIILWIFIIFLCSCTHSTIVLETINDEKKIYIKYDIEEKNNLNIKYIDTYITALNDSYYIREEAAKLLGKFGPKAKKAVPNLIKLINKSPEAIKALGQIGPDAKQAVPSLIAALDDRNCRKNSDIVKALGSIGPKAKAAIPELNKSLLFCNNSSCLETCKETVISLSQFRTDAIESIPALIEALKVSDSEISESISKAFVNICNKKNISILISRLHHHDSNVRRYVAKAIGEINNKKALPELIKLLKDNNGLVRYEADLAIQKIQKFSNNFEFDINKEPINTEGSFANSDSTPPIIRIHSKRAIEVVSNSTQTIHGHAKDDSGVAIVKVNGEEAQLDSSGNFISEILLVPGKNNIIVRAWDKYRNTSQISFIINRQFKKITIPTSAKNKFIEKYYALIIGNNDYLHISNLKTAVNDAIAINKLLINKYDFKTKILLNATRSQVLKEINYFRKIIKTDDHFIIFYAGHGTFDNKIQKAYWLPVDADTDEDTKWIISDIITANIKRINSNHILVIADSCYSGTLSREAVYNLVSNDNRSKYISKMLKKKSRTLMSSGGNEPVSDIGGGGHSIFTKAFIEGLNEMEEDVFTAEEFFYKKIKESVAGQANQTPEYKTIRNSGHNGGDFIFSKKK